MCQTAKSWCAICPFPRAGMSGADSPIPSTHQQLPLNWVPNKVKARNNREQNKDWEGKDPEGNTKSTTWAMRWWMKEFLSHCGVRWRPWSCHYQALTVIISSPKPLPGQHSLTNLLSLFKRKWETSLNQPHKTPTWPSHGDIHQDCSNFTWLSLYGPQAPVQELVLEQEAQKNSCRREIPAYQSQYKQPAFNSQGKNLANQSSHPTMLFHTTDASPPQLVLSFISVSR